MVALSFRNTTTSQEKPVSELSEPVTISIPLERGITDIASPKCSYWNANKLQWDTTGCQERNNTNPNATCLICECNHLTSFSMAFDNAFTESGFQYFDDFSAFADKDWVRIYGMSSFSTSHILFLHTVLPITVLLLLTLLFLLIWGKQRDRQDEILMNTIANKNSVLNAGFSNLGRKSGRSDNVAPSQAKASKCEVFAHAFKVSLLS